MSRTILIEGSVDLSFQLPNKKRFRLVPSYEDGFSIVPGLTAGPNNLYFLREANGSITGLRISIDRARNILFEKKKQ